VSHDHQTVVKFTGSGYQAHCTTPGCHFIGRNYQLFKYQRYGRVGAVHRAEMLAQNDARRHRTEERRNARGES
jgi:hypothetical protein